MLAPFSNALCTCRICFAACLCVVHSVDHACVHDLPLRPLTVHVCVVWLHASTRAILVPQ